MQKTNINLILERQKLKDNKREIENMMRGLKDKFDLMNKREFEEKMILLQQKFKEIEKNLNHNPDHLELSRLIGLEKDAKRQVQNLADFTSYKGKSREEILKDQKEA